MFNIMMFRILFLVIGLSMTTHLFAVQMVRVLPIFEEGKDKTVLLSLGAKQWSAYGGNHRNHFKNRPIEAISDFRGQKRREAPAKAALRIFKERTGHYNFPEITLSRMNAAPFIDFINCDNCTHRLYFLKIQKKPSIDEILNKSNRAKSKIGIDFSYKYFKAEDLLNSMNTGNHKLPGEKVNLNSYFMNAFRTPHAKNMFAKAANLPIPVRINTPKLNRNGFHKKFAAPFRCTTPKRLATPIKRTTPNRLAAPIKHTTPKRSAAPVRNTTPKRSAVPIKRTAPNRLAAPVKRTTPKRPQNRWGHR